MKEKNNTSGFTLIELLIGSLIAIMIFLTTSSVFLLLYSADAKTRRIQTMEQSKNDIQQDMSTAVRWANNVTWNGSVLDLDSVTKYEVLNSKLTRNGESLIANDVSVTGFEVKDYSLVTDYPSYEIVINLSLDSSPVMSDRLRIVVSKRKLQFLGSQPGGGGPIEVEPYDCSAFCGGGNDNGGGGGPGPGR